MLSAGCVKADLYDTAHPDTGRISVTADWSARGEGVDIPTLWQIGIGDYAGEETGTTHVAESLFTPGSYRIAAWNPAAEITVSGTTATVATAEAEKTASNAPAANHTPATAKTAAANDSGTSTDGSERFVNGAPGWLFTALQDVEIKQDRDHEFTVSMQQQVRQLIVKLTFRGDSADRVAGIEGSLSGVAGSYDFAADSYGNASSVALHFTQITEGEDAGKWQAAVRLLGITGGEQLLTGTIRFTDNNPQSISLASDLSASLAGFNSTKNQPQTLSGTVVETSTEAGVTATIGDWNAVLGDPVEAL